MLEKDEINLLYGFTGLLANDPVLYGVVYMLLYMYVVVVYVWSDAV